ncbi:MAG: hypothetical protein LUH18_03650 [Oscillospiraceae bacterium]|nr:hypothetical protein [Oscillospiraceae bacterium]
MATDIEILSKAKMYMEKLASGVDPISGNLAPEDDVINQLKLSRCFTYVAGVLQSVIDNGGKVEKTAKSKKLPFYLPLEVRDDFRFSDNPIPVSNLAERINSLIDTDTMSEIKYRSITSWLISVGILEEIVDSNGKTKKVPTKNGNTVGITSQQRTEMYGVYYVTVYNRAAQKFILDNIDTITDVNNSRYGQRENAGQPWSEEHDECLRDLYLKDVSISEIAVTLKRSNNSIRERLKKFGLLDNNETT